MITWVELQSVAAIALLVCGFCYLLTAAVLLATAALAVARPRIADALKATSPVMLTPLAVVAGLLIAFLAARVWSNLDRANALVAQEAGAIHELVLLADALPPGDTRAALQSGVRTYLRFVEAEDFPAMTAGRAGSGPPPSLVEAMGVLLAFVPTGPGQQIVRERAVAASEAAMEARRGRVLLSRAEIAPIQWLVVLILDALILLVIAMVHIDRRLTAAVNLFIFSTAMAACLVLLMAYDRPFSPGGFTVRLDVLHEIGAAG